MGNQIIENILTPNIVSFNPINIIDSFLSLIYAAIFGLLIAYSYRYSSQSISGSRQIVSSLLPLTLTVCVIITVVKSSLALSLGLVGALSIVRFRTPVKEPEDLVYLFLAIVTGLGFGASQNLFTTLGVSIILAILAFRSFFLSKKYKRIKGGYDFNINLEWDESESISISEIIDCLSILCEQISFIRFNKVKTYHNLSLQVNLLHDKNIELLTKNISELNKDISIQIYSSAIEY